MTRDAEGPPTVGLLPAEIVSLGDGDEGDISLLAAVSFVLRHVRMFFLVPLACAILAMILALLFGRSYTAVSQVVPEGGGGEALGRYAAIAAQIGILPGGMDGGESPDFYAALVKSPELLRKLSQTRFSFDDDDEHHEGTIIALYEIDRPTPHRTQLAAINQLQGAIHTTTDLTSGILEIRTESQWAPLSELINRRLLTLIDEFNDERRQRVAAAERAFVEGRMASAEGELRAAQTELQRFLEANRTYQNSPQLAMTAERLRGVVALRQQVYLALAQAHEQARIEAVRNTPQVTVITSPEGTADRRRLLVYIIIGGIAGVVLALLTAFVWDWVQRDRARQPEGYATLRKIRIRDIYGTMVARRAKAAPSAREPQ